MHTHTLALFSLASLSSHIWLYCRGRKKRKNSLATVMGLRKRHTGLEKKKAKRKRWTHTEIDQFSNREIPFFCVDCRHTLKHVKPRTRSREAQKSMRGRFWVVAILSENLLVKTNSADWLGECKTHTHTYRHATNEVSLSFEMKRRVQLFGVCVFENSQEKNKRKKKKTATMKKRRKRKKMAKTQCASVLPKKKCQIEMTTDFFSTPVWEELKRHDAQNSWLLAMWFWRLLCSVFFLLFFSACLVAGTMDLNLVKRQRKTEFVISWAIKRMTTWITTAPDCRWLANQARH